ncbi:pyridoxamine 5'-phosphate oxidase family protein [Polaribacter sp.]|uniref:pyridoxamine 5'-phosphate oxidase family protein n=1 Tax=Polaribacter sp. TaxID=1920175 RepID=UPI003F6BB5CE
MKYLYIFLTVLLFVNCHNPVKKTKLEIAREILQASKNCALITVDPAGVAHARTMDPFLPQNDFTIWMATKPQSKKVVQLKNNPKATLYYFDAKTVSYVSLFGEATLINSAAEKEKYWKEEWVNFYNNKTTGYILIKFTPKSGTIISEKYNLLGDSITWKAPQLNF